MITRRHVLQLASAPLGSATLLRAGAAARPNIVLIMADDLGWETLGCYGGASYRTPNLDRMARGGVRFTHAYAQPLCTPTRIQLMTGQYNFRNWRAFGIMDPEERTFGHMMQRAGYCTCITGKWQFYSYDGAGSPRRGIGMPVEKSGFDEHFVWHAGHTEDKGSRYAAPTIQDNGRLRRFNKDHYGPDLFSDYGCRFIERNRERPFFLYYPMVLTHGPYNPTPRSGDWVSGDRLKASNRYFADMVQYMDEVVGRILKKIDDLGLASRTLVLFYSDNGTGPGLRSLTKTGPVDGGKGLTTDAGMHVPLLARWPGPIPEGRVADALIDSTDFLPTIAEASGANWFDGVALDGESFLPGARRAKGRRRDWLFSHYDPHPGCKQRFSATRFAWDRQWKLYMDGRLFRIDRDPLEQHPVVSPGADAEAARTRLQAVLDRMAKIRPPVFNEYSSYGEA